MTLEEFFKQNKRVALGFSGGVDSTYLLYAAIKAGADVRPYYIKTAFQPQFEFEDAMKVGKQLNIKITVIEKDILSNKSVAENPKDRCYYCKTALFGTLQKQALADGYAVLLDGTNASDDVNDRPGMKALCEIGVRSPLRECGLTKDNIRELSKKAGLFTWNKPAYACLATRIPSGNIITSEALSAVEQAENSLFKLGFTDFRVRIFHGAAKLQFPDSQIERAALLRNEIKQSIAPLFNEIFIDLAGR